jgi:hypothetical protein
MSRAEQPDGGPLPDGWHAVARAPAPPATAMAAVHQELGRGPAPPFRPYEISVDAGDGAIGVLFAAPPGQPGRLHRHRLTQALGEHGDAVARFLEQAFGEEPDAAPVRVGFAVRGALSTAYAERIGAHGRHRLVDLHGAHDLEERVQEIMVRLGRTARIEGVSLRVAGGPPRLKYYLPVRGGDAVQLARCVRALGGEASVAEDAMGHLLGSADEALLRSGRVTLTLVDDAPPGVALALDGRPGSDAAVLVLVYLLLGHLGLSGEGLNQFALEWGRLYPWQATHAISFVAIEPVSRSPRLRLWVRP